MKKVFFLLTLSGMFLMCSCGENKPSDTEVSQVSAMVTTSISDNVSETTTSISENKEIQTTSEEITVTDTETSSTAQTSEIIQTQAQTQTVQTTSTQVMETFPEPESQPFETDDNGAVIMEVHDDTEDSEIISAAQELYENACETEFRYHVGCPYNLDYNSYVENSYGWQYYLVTDEGYTTIADVEKDYYKKFAEENGSDLSEIYIEQDGRLYAFDGERGANVFYESSEVTGIIEKSDNKIVFSVDNHYTGNDIDPGTPVTETEQFSVVIKDGEWRVGEFYLPY